MKKIITLVLSLVFLSQAANIISVSAAHNPYKKISADSFDEKYIISSVGLQMFEIRDGLVGGTYAGDSILFKNVDFGEIPPVMVNLRMALPAIYDGSIEIRVGSKDGKLLATAKPTPSEFYQPVDNFIDLLFPITGTHDIYFVWTQITAQFSSMQFYLPKEDGKLRRPFGEDWFSDISDSSFRSEINFLQGLGISKGYNDGTFLPEMPTSRFEFALMIDKLLNIKKTFQEPLYSDIPVDYPNFNQINTLKDLGIMVGFSDNTFRPNDFIIFDDAVATLIKLLGYEELVKLIGVYPNGYLQTATKIGLTKGITSDSKYLSREKMIKLILNALKVESVDISSVSNDGATYQKSKYILEKNADIYNDMGVISANDETSIYKVAGTNKKKQVEIKNVIYNVGNSGAGDFLGKNCEFFYSNIDDVKTIVAIRESKQVVKVKLNGKDVTQINSNYILYEENDKKEKKYNIDTKTSVIYNGKFLENIEFDKLLTLQNYTVIKGDLVKNSEMPLKFKGEITWVDNNSDNIADIIFIDSYVNYLLSGYDIVNNTFYDKLGKKQLDLDDVNLDFTLDKKEVELISVNPNTTAKVYKSLNTVGNSFLKIEAVTTELKGYVESSSKDGLIIDGKLYTVSDEYTNGISDLSLREINVGDFINAKINSSNEIVWIINEAKEEKFKIGVIIAFAAQKGLDDGHKIKLFSIDNKMEVLSLKQRVMIDDETGVDIEKFFLNFDFNTPIRYSVDKSGEIAVLDTYKGGLNNQNDLLSLIMPTNDGKSLMYLNTNVLTDEGGTITGGNQYAVSKDATLIYRTSKTPSDNAADYKIAPILGSIRDGLKNTVYTLYSYQNNSKVADIIMKTGPISKIDENDIFIFDKIGSGIDTEGNICNILFGVTRTGTKKTYQVSDDIEVDSLINGTMLYLHIDDSGKINSLEKIFNGDASPGGYVSKDVPANRYLSYDYHKYLYGTVQQYDRDFLIVTREYSETEKYDEIFDIEGSNVLVCVKVDGFYKFYPGNKNSIIVGDKVVLHINLGKPSNIIVYRGELK